MENSQTYQFGASFFLSLLKTGTVIGASCVLLGFLGRKHWVLDLMAQLRVQWAIGFLGLIVLFSLFRKRKWALISLAFLAINTAPMWPYVKGPVSQKSITDIEEKSGALKLMSFNVLTHNSKKAEAITAIKTAAPDVLLLMEVDAKWENSVRAALSSDYPHMAFQAREDNFGIALLSKTPWDHLEIYRSAPQDLPSIDVIFKDESSRPIRILGTHPFPPLGGRNWNIRNLHLMDTAKRVHVRQPTVMIGDFNLTPWSPVFKDLIASSGLKDSSASFGLTPTWDVVASPIGALKIDHALVSEDVHVTNLNIQKVDGSDHRALILDIQY